LSRAPVTKSDDVLAPDHGLTPRELDHQRPVEARVGGEAECLEVLYRREPCGADAAVLYRPLAVDPFEFGEARLRLGPTLDLLNRLR